MSVCPTVSELHFMDVFILVQITIIQKKGVFESSKGQKMSSVGVRIFIYEKTF